MYDVVSCTVCTVFHGVGIFGGYTVSQTLYLRPLILGGYFYVMFYLHTVENFSAISSTKYYVRNLISGATGFSFLFFFNQKKLSFLV